jgi:hypothetical protein
MLHGSHNSIYLVKKINQDQLCLRHKAILTYASIEAFESIDAKRHKLAGSKSGIMKKSGRSFAILLDYIYLFKRPHASPNPVFNGL